MSTAAIFNRLGQSIMPRVLSRSMPDSMTIKLETSSAGTGGGRIKSGATDYAINVPCAYEHIQKFGWRKSQGEKNTSTQMYLVTMPTHTINGMRISLDPKSHHFVVDERGNEPAKTFKIISVGDVMGAIFEVVCSRED